MANGTTLGADNGIAVATNLAIMEDASLEHGPLELLFTIDEETGLTGAHALQPGFVDSPILLNLDSEDEGVLYVGCSGGKDTTGTWTVETEAAPAGSKAIEVKVTGLRGGHSGLEIDKGRGNALKVLNRTLMALEGAGARLARIDGGNKRNAIPREATARVFVPARQVEAAMAAVAEWNGILRHELSTVEPDLAVTATASRARTAVFKKKYQKAITRVIAALPHGVTKMSADLPGLVETSTNVAVITTRGKKVELATSQRSSVASEIAEVAHTVRVIFEMGGAEVRQGDGYPGWKPNMGSAILKTAKSTYKQLFGKTPDVRAVHAGLECGIIGEKFPGMDTISFGPTIRNAHSPDECVSVPSVANFWKYLTALLPRM
jgi:dipeptidase D